LFFIAFQIRDWLTVLETMLKQQVVIVGDSEDVLLLLEKQKVLCFLFFYQLTILSSFIDFPEAEGGR
jgi:hypothetical protein